MSVLDLLKGNYDLHVADWTPLRPKSSRWFKTQFQSTAAGIPVTHDTVLNSSAAMACTRAISETLASLPAIVHEQMGNDVKRKARENPMWSLLHDQPNPEMDSMTWYEINASRVVNRGNAVSLIEYNGRGLPIALWPVHNSRFEIWRQNSRQGPNGRFFPGERFYRIWPDETERFFDVPPEDILNVVSWDTDNGQVGRGVMERAKQEVALDIAQVEFAGSMFKNGALPLGLIKHPWLDDVEQRDGLREDINSVHSGRENWNKIGILWDKDADWIKLGYSPEDVQAIESRVFTAKSLCRYYNVPPAIVQIFEDYKFATVEAMLKHFIMLTIRPYAIRFERAINTQILSQITDSSLMLEFALEGLLRGDPEKQAKMNALYRGWGVLNADEIRQRDLGMNPIEDGLGEIRLAPMNHAPLDQVAAGNTRQQNNGRPQPRQEQAKWDRNHFAAMATTAGGKDVERHIQQSAADKERLAVLGRIKHGPDGFLKWLDDFYVRLKREMCEQASIAGLTNGQALADGFVSKRRGVMLAACECSRDEFVESIKRALS